MPLFGLRKANRRRTVAPSSKREDNIKATSSQVPAEAETEESAESAELDASSADAEDSATATDDAPEETADADSGADESGTSSDKKSAKKKADKKAEDKGAAGAKQKNRKAEPAKKSKNAAKSGNPAKRASARKQTKYESGSSDASLRPNPRWFLPTMLTVIIVGMLWLIVFYLSNGTLPVEVWGNWNLLAGFGIMVAGLAMSTRWR